MKAGKLKVLKFSDGDTVQLIDEQYRLGSMIVLGYESGDPYALVNVECRGVRKCYLESVLELAPSRSSHDN